MYTSDKTGDSLRQLTTRDYTFGASVGIVGFGLHSYYVRELLASLFLFSVIFFFLGIVVLGVFLAWCASEQVAVWTRPALSNFIAFSRRLIAAYAKS